MATAKRKTAAASRKTATARKTRATNKTAASKRTAAKSPRTPKKNAAVTPPVKEPLNPCRLISVFGPFNNYVLVQMPADYALELFRDIGQPASRSLVIQAVEGEIRALEERAVETGTEFRESYAAVAVEMALQLEHPFNSATSKSMCAKALNETMDKLHALAPAEQSGDGVDELQKKRDTRRQAAAVAQ